MIDRKNFHAVLLFINGEVNHERKFFHKPAPDIGIPKWHTFYTDYRMSSAQLDEIREYTQNLGRNDLVARVYLENAAGEVTSGLFFGPARMFIRLVGDEANIVIKLVNSAGDILKNTDFSLLKEVSYSVPGYGTGRGIVFVDPSENLKGAIHEIRQLVTDRYGNKAVEITDDAGKHLGIEAKDPGSLLDEGGEIANLLLSLRTKVGEAHWPSFAKDFDQNVEMLRKFDGEEGLVDSWKVFKDVNLSDAIRKNPANLESLSKAMKQNGYNATYFENLLKSKIDP